MAYSNKASLMEVLCTYIIREAWNETENITGHSSFTNDGQVSPT